MEFSGQVQNGVISLPEGVSLPDGTPVVVTCASESASKKMAPPRKRVQIPLVRTGRPGTLNLTNDLIAEILDDEDIASARR